MLKQIFVFLNILLIIKPIRNCGEVNKIPIVINTWGFSNATIKAWDVINREEKSAVSFCLFVVLLTS
jgi:hypothetical protein